LTNRVSAIFAHPDDEVLGCGGALAAHAAAGDEVQVLLLATGLSARGSHDEQALQVLRGQSEAAARELGVAHTTFADFPDNSMDSVPLLKVIRKIEEFLDDFQPQTIYTHYDGDLNVDHRAVNAAVATACRPLPDRKDLAILACEVNSSTEWSLNPDDRFHPTEFLDISDFLEAKLRALRCFEDEIRDWPHPRSVEGVEALARWRGAQSGLGLAEAYATLRRRRSTVG